MDCNETTEKCDYIKLLSDTMKMYNMNEKTYNNNDKDDLTDLLQKDNLKHILNMILNIFIIRLVENVNYQIVVL